MNVAKEPRGSPPQVRGKRWALWMSIAALRITPAGAGKTALSAECVGIVEDHPRRCGENFAVVVWFAAAAGSPPQVRGKLLNKRQCVINIRITPAGAGKTNLSTAKKATSRDHPRRCGENLTS